MVSGKASPRSLRAVSPLYAHTLSNTSNNDEVLWWVTAPSPRAPGIASVARAFRGCIDKSDPPSPKLRFTSP